MSNFSNTIVCFYADATLIGFGCRFITTPLLLMDILLTAGIPWPTIIFTIFLDEFMIVTGLVGALVKSRYKWGMSTFWSWQIFPHVLLPGFN